MYPLNGALPGPMCQCDLANPYPPSAILWNDLANPVFDGVGLAAFKSRANIFLLAQAALSLLLSSTIFPFLFFLSLGWYCGAGERPPTVQAWVYYAVRLIN